MARLGIPRPGQHEERTGHPHYRHQQGSEIGLAIDLHQRQTAKHGYRQHQQDQQRREQIDSTQHLCPSTTLGRKNGNRQEDQWRPILHEPGNRIHADHVAGYYGGQQFQHEQENQEDHGKLIGKPCQHRIGDEGTSSDHRRKHQHPGHHQAGRERRDDGAEQYRHDQQIPQAEPVAGPHHRLPQQEEAKMSQRKRPPNRILQPLEDREHQHQECRGKENLSLRQQRRPVSHPDCHLGFTSPLEPHVIVLTQCQDPDEKLLNIRHY